MNTREKFEAIQALDPDVSIKLATNGKWYVSAKISISDGQFVTSVCCHENNMESTIDAYWEKITALLAPDEKLVISSFGKDKYYTWNGFMWKECS
jgi:hypothetical protein